MYYNHLMKVRQNLNAGFNWLKNTTHTLEIVSCSEVHSICISCDYPSFLKKYGYV